VHIGKRQVEEIVATAAHDFEAFYGHSPCRKTSSRQAQSQPIQVLTFDGKAVGDCGRRGLRGRHPQRRPKPARRGRPAVFPTTPRRTANGWRR